jgi:hypothetical protein
MELIELLGYFLGFWLFIFNRKFREMIIADWKISGVAGKIFIILGAFSSFFCGVLVPLWILNIVSTS